MPRVKLPDGSGFREVEIVEEDNDDYGRYKTSSRRREYGAKWRKENPQKVKEYNDFWNHAPKVKAMKLAYDRTPKRKAYKHAWYLKRKRVPK